MRTENSLQEALDADRDFRSLSEDRRKRSVSFAMTNGDSLRDQRGCVLSRCDLDFSKPLALAELSAPRHALVKRRLRLE